MNQPTKIFFLFLLACFSLLAQAQPGAIYSPPAGSLLAAVNGFSWGPSTFVPSGPDSYFIEGGTGGCFTNDWYAGSWTLSPHLGLFQTQPPVTDIWMTVYFYDSPTTMAARCTMFSAHGPGAVITYQTMQYELTSNLPTFQVTANTYPYTVSLGWSNAFPATEIMDHVQVSAPSFQPPVPIPYRDQHEFITLTLEQGGVTHSYTFHCPIAPKLGTMARTELPGLYGQDTFAGSFAQQPTENNPMVGPAAVPFSGTPPDVSDFSAGYVQVGGEYRYTFKVDTRNLALVRVGEPLESAAPSLSEYPKGWAPARFFFTAIDETAERKKDSVFAITTSWRPGLVALALRSGNDLGAGIMVNAKREFVIGPAFAPDLDEAGILARVKTWAEDYGFGFLSPLLNGKRLVDLAPESPLELQIVDALRAVLQ